MSAKNRVINGDYAGSQVVGGGAANAAISLGIIKQLRLNSSTVESYEVLGGVAGANKVCIDRIMGHKSKGTGERVYTHKNIEELKMNIELITN